MDPSPTATRPDVADQRREEQGERLAAAPGLGAEVRESLLLLLLSLAVTAGLATGASALLTLLA